METADSTPPTPSAQQVTEYRILPADEAAAETLASACGLGATAAQVLLHRGIRDVGEATTFLDAKLQGLSAPGPMADRARAAERLASAVRKSECIVVFGDYDVDGTTSALILTEVIRALGGDARTLIADRFHGGYGLSDPALLRCLAEGPSVIVTCDCGSSDHERIGMANQRGIDVIVVDHHLVPEETLPAFAFLNPHRPECGFPYKGLCSAGLALSLSAALRTELGAELDIRAWLDLVAIGTIADIAPLTGDNRRLVRAGLRALGSGRVRPAFQALRQVTKLPETAHLTSQDIAFRFAPRLNAPGRLGEADLTLRFLQAKTARDAWSLVEEVERRNDERKSLTHKATEEARAQVLEAYGEAPTTGIVVANDGWHRGVVGIVAARLVDAFNVPAVVVAFDGDQGHGSVRTTRGFDAYDALERCADDLTAWGGHRAAAGLSLSKRRFESFRASFSEMSLEPEGSLEVTSPIDVELGGVYRIPTLDDLVRLGPFGEGNRAPRFLLNAGIIEATGVGQDRSHAKLQLRVGEDSVRAFGPGMFSRIEGRQNGRFVGEFQPDHWIGGQAVEFLVTDVLP